MRPQILDDLAGRWPDVLRELAGVTSSQLCSKEGPCPACYALTGDAGRTRFRWRSSDGDGDWYCSHCGGPQGTGGPGNGLDLLSRIVLQRYGKAAFMPALELLEAHYGQPNGKRSKRQRSGNPAYTPPPRPAPKRWPSSEQAAYQLLSAVDQIAVDESYSPSKASGKSYTSRWNRWAAEANEEEVAQAFAILDSIAFQEETESGTIKPPKKETAPLPPVKISLDKVRIQLSKAVSDGFSGSSLQALVIDLAGKADQAPSTIKNLLSAIQKEQLASDDIAAEAERLAVAADLSQIGRAYLTLESFFPSNLADALRTRVRYLPADDITAAGVFLATLAASVKLGSELVASRACGFRVPLNLYGALVAKSGSKKSPVWSLLLTSALSPIIADMARNHARSMEAWKSENQGKKPIERTEQPKALRVMCSEYTAEALATQLQHQEEAGLGLLIAREEIAGLFGGLNAYRGGRGADNEQLLEAYDGRGASSLRVGADGGGRFYQGCQLSIFGTIQPKVLQKLVEDTDGDASGLWARFLFIPVPERVVPLPEHESEDDGDRSDAAAALIERVIQQVWRLPRVSLALEPAARSAFMRYEARCQSDALRASLPAQGAAWGKAPGKVLRVAGLLHLAAVACEAEQLGIVSSAQIQAASNLVDHLTGWSLGIHQAAATGGNASDLMQRLHRLSQASGGPVGWRDLSRSLSTRKRAEIDPATAQAAAMALVELRVGTMGDGVRVGSWTYQATADLHG